MREIVFDLYDHENAWKLSYDNVIDKDFDKSTYALVDNSRGTWESVINSVPSIQLNGIILGFVAGRTHDYIRIWIFVSEFQYEFGDLDSRSNKENLLNEILDWAQFNHLKDSSYQTFNLIEIE